MRTKDLNEKTATLRRPGPASTASPAPVASGGHQVEWPVAGGVTVSSGNETIRLPGVGFTPADGGDVNGMGDLTPDLVARSTWSDELLARAGIPVIDAPFVSVGGGIGSFVMADVLRIAGVPATSIKALGAPEHPWQTYKYLTEASQIPSEERLRSDSSSIPDCLWGFPGLAFREAFSKRRPTEFLAPLWQVATEPILTDYFTPKAGQVFRGMEREAQRIGYESMSARGLVRMTRKRDGGGYFTVLTPPAGTAGTKRVAYRSRYVHIAVGYPGVKFLPDLQAYREKFNDQRVVNAYERHEHVYEELQRREGTVVVRGSGIVASRILQRLIDDRDKRGAKTSIAHLFRTYVDGPHGPSVFMRRRGGDGWAYQGFNWPKAAWGGQLKYQLEKLEGEERKAFLGITGGTNTPRRKLWQEQLRRGRRDGFYKTYVGEVEQVLPASDGRITTRIKTSDGVLEIPANYVIDATGLEADIREHRMLADLLDHSGVCRNPLGRLDVERTFEVRGTRNGDARMYAAGAATLGGYYSGVDTFLGLQYAALQICDDLAQQGFCKRIGVTRSIAQWWRWALNRSI